MSGQAREEDAASVYGYTGRPRANGQVELKRGLVRGRATQEGNALTPL